MSTNYKGKHSTELKKVLDFFENELIIQYPNINELSFEHLVYSFLANEECLVCQALNRVLLGTTIEEIKEYCIRLINDNSSKINNEVKVNKDLLNIINSFNNKNVNTIVLLSKIIDSNESVRKMFERNGVSINEIINTLKEWENNNNNDVITFPIKHKKKKTNKDTQRINASNINIKTNEVEKHLTNLNVLAEDGLIDEIYGNNDVINNIFSILNKRNKNNVIITGDSGIGKTATVKHIANLINNDLVPKSFKNKTLMLMDFTSLITNTAFKGAFESKFETIIRDAKTSAKYIFFIDDIQSILSDRSKFGEIDIVSLLDKILMERNIQVIATCSNKGYRNCIENNNSLSRRFQKIVMSQPSYENTINILNIVKKNIELYHNVSITDKAIEEAVKLGTRYINNVKQPDCAIDLIDETAARKILSIKPSEKMVELLQKLNDVLLKKEEIEDDVNRDYDLYDILTKQEISLRSKISTLEKDEVLLSNPFVVDENDVREVISSKTNIPLNQITIDEKQKLKNIDKLLKEKVIGQDEAVNAVTKVIKRQRVGISNPNKPATFLFVGQTGTGKTYLAKNIAKELFGDEKYLVRFDMSEYSDKTSTNKLIGSSPGYVGYEQGGQLTEAIKKNKYCVLLLDEIEKANEDIHNIFLQLFDEGRMTDNMGTTVDFKNVIVIMTSNVGARQINERGEGMGFNKNSNDASRAILDKELKKTFKPEFINRIDKIVYFDKLTTDNLRNIIHLEVNNVAKKINEIGYKLDKDITDGKLIDNIYNSIIPEIQYGARPILRQVQEQLEDVITDYILSNEIESGHIFNYNELYEK